MAVQAAGLTISGLRIAARIRRTVDTSSDSGEVKIWNLAPETERLLNDRGETVVVEGGYRGNVGTLFEGQAQQVIPDREFRQGVARITTIRLGDFTRAVRPNRAQRLGGITARSYSGPVPVRSVARHLAEDLGLPLGPLDAIGAEATVTNWSWSGRSADGLRLLLRTVECGWYEDAGLIRVRRIGEGTQPDLGTLLIAPSTGMVGAPARTDEGVRVTTLLNPAVELSLPIRVVSEIVSGDFRVVAFEHRADNRAAKHQTVIEART